MIVKLREQIIQQLKIKEKLKTDIQHLQQNHKADIREREQIEHLLNRDLTVAKDEISEWNGADRQTHRQRNISVVLQSLQTEYERVLNLKNELEKQLEERVNELKMTKTVANSFTNQLKEKLEQMSGQKVRILNAHLSKREDYFRHKRKKKMLRYAFKFRNWKSI